MRTRGRSKVFCPSGGVRGRRWLREADGQTLPIVAKERSRSDAGRRRERAVPCQREDGTMPEATISVGVNRRSEKSDAEVKLAFREK